MNPKLRAQVGMPICDHVDPVDRGNLLDILQALERSNGVVAGPHGAAQALGIKRSTLQSRMQRLGIRR